MTRQRVLRDPVADSVVQAAGGRILHDLLPHLAEYQARTRRSTRDWQLREQLEHLDAVEVLTHRFGLRDGVPKSEGEIAAALDVSRLQVKFVSEWALTALTDIAMVSDNDLELREYYHDDVPGIRSASGRDADPSAFYRLLGRNWDGPMCPRCNMYPVIWSGKGRPPKTCSAACRQALYRQRKKGEPTYPENYDPPPHVADYVPPQARNKPSAQEVVKRRVRAAGGLSFDHAVWEFRGSEGVTRTFLSGTTSPKQCGQHVADVMSAAELLSSCLQFIFIVTSDRAMPGQKGRAVLAALARVLHGVELLEDAVDGYWRSTWRDAPSGRAPVALAQVCRRVREVGRAIDEVYRRMGCPQGYPFLVGADRWLQAYMKSEELTESCEESGPTFEL